MEKTYYTKSHEWLNIHNDSLIIVGITKYAVKMLGELVFIDLPKINTKYSKGEVNIVIESVKAASDVYAPLECIVTDINSKLETDLSILSNAPESDGWIYKAKLQNEDFDFSELMTASQYKTYCNQS